MPSGPDHYRHAEEMADEAAERLQHMDWDAAVAWAAAAQVHATLANAAAIALAPGRRDEAGRHWAAQGDNRADHRPPQDERPRDDPPWALSRCGGGARRRAIRTYDRNMARAWVEVSDGWGWGPVRVLRGRLEDDGYHTDEYRLARGVMIHVTGARLPEMADPPAWRGRSNHSA